jgi:hypothetical protein
MWQKTRRCRILRRVYIARDGDEARQKFLRGGSNAKYIRRGERDLVEDHSRQHTCVWRDNTKYNSTIIIKKLYRQGLKIKGASRWRSPNFYLARANIISHNYPARSSFFAQY